MKKSKQNFVVLITVLVLIKLQASGQATSFSPTNTPNLPTDYLGWNFLTPQFLTIQHQANQQIRFFTDIANPTGPAPTFNSPSDRLRIDREFRVVPGGGFGNGPFFLTRVGITEGGLNTGVALDWNGANARPLSLLHLGQAWTFNGGGHRPWMDIGTFYSAGTDMMYTGLKEESHAVNPPLWTDNMDAILGWGDNINPPAGADNLRVVFSAGQLAVSGDAGNLNSLEVMRFTPVGRIGIGNFTAPAFGTGSGIQPARRLEIYDENVLNVTIPAATQYAPAPQLRLTLTPALANTIALPNNIINTGTWTDFQTNLNPPGVIAPFVPNGIANLYIHPGSDNFAAGVPANGRVGINIAQAGNTLEINAIGNQFGDAVPPTAGVTRSGLRFNATHHPAGREAPAGFEKRSAQSISSSISFKWQYL